MKNKTKLLTTALLLVLFTFSPLAIASSSSHEAKATTSRAPTPTSRAPTPLQLAKMSPEQRVKALEPWLHPSGTPVLSNLGKYTAAQIYQALGVNPSAQNKACAKACSYIADAIGALQAINSKNLMATVLTGTSSDPHSCPTSAYFADGVVWVSDPCGNDYAGEIRTFNPTTWAQGGSVTTEGMPSFMVLGPDGNLYVTNFGYQTVSIIDPSNGEFLNYFYTCYSYPLFLDSDPANGNVYVGDLYAGFYYWEGSSVTEGCMDAYNPATFTDTTIILSNAICTGCGTAAGVSVNQKSGTIYAIDPFSYYEGTNNDAYLISGTSQFETLTLQPDALLPWGSTYDPANHDVLVVVTVDLSCSPTCGGFEAINSGNGQTSIIDTGMQPQAACYNTGKVATLPEYTSFFPAQATNVKSDLALKQITLSSFGLVDAYGCGGS